jgi:hypothetical protein
VAAAGSDATVAEKELVDRTSRSSGSPVQAGALYLVIQQSRPRPGAALVRVPCPVLLGLGLNRGERVLGALRRLHERFGTEAAIPPSRWRAAAYAIAGVVVAAIAVSV